MIWIHGQQMIVLAAKPDEYDGKEQFNAESKADWVEDYFSTSHSAWLEVLTHMATYDCVCLYLSFIGENRLHRIP